MVCSWHPWKFKLNHHADLVTKFCLVLFCMLTVNLVDDEPVGVTFLGILMIGTTYCLLLVVLVEIARHIWRQRIALVATLARRVSFAQKLHDVVKIVGAESSLKLRAYALGLNDNDEKRLDVALDVLTCTMLKLQPQSRFRWRCAPFPFEVAVDGRLEGEMIVRGVESHDDDRCLARKMLSMLKEEQIRNSKPNEASLFDAASGVDSQTANLLSFLDSDGEGQVAEDEFITRMKHHFGDPGPFTDAELTDVFEYFDVDSSGTLTIVELAHALSGVPDPVHPNLSAQHRRESARETAYVQSLGTSQSVQPAADPAKIQEGISVHNNTMIEEQPVIQPSGTDDVQATVSAKNPPATDGTDAGEATINAENSPPPVGTVQTRSSTAGRPLSAIGLTSI
eukprot:gnl/MRDRNA2_/MRDRNA2_238196_c0_seq1.p1 gnl/MRDRNA2_/MRDRNA2_238196_c0~~gnl/MRDRNA2_/MRDRNA2_238196_c0_seq1.p1  ORF type:complete len:395 (+),score=79.49 gnl/MRDRNA2_/MRDRNA2_238196_c0_seq1:1-1185(+)